ncbi:MAG: Fe-S cluster assembly protein SufD [Lactobacillus sp.]|jgi:Fe-S cluster assembly protein SufD|nr:Fe-S cluster assembly protein SufD [Lactobacillus sp.]
MARLIQNPEMVGEAFPELQKLRNEGRKAFVMPCPKMEAWKYTKLRDLDADDYVMATNDNLGSFDFGLDCYVINFNNGVFSPLGSKLPEDVEVYPLIEEFMPGGGCQCKGECIAECEAKKYLNKNINLTEHPFAALNTAYLQEGMFIKIEGKLDKPIAIINRSKTDENLFYNTRNLIILEDDAEAEILEIFEYQGDIKSRYFGNHVNEIFVGKRAKLNHYKLQDEAYKTNHIALSMAEVAEKGKYDHFCLQKGANIGRNEVIVKLMDSEAQANVNGAYIMYGWATLDTTTEIRHLAPATFSHQLVKGVIGGDARGVFQGKIHIGRNAVKTEGIQQHRALLLSDTAEIDCKPELEIFADDVKCSHGAASGELDEDALFYMESRGISREEAKQILIDAYLDEVVEKVENPEIKEYFKRALEPAKS